MSLYRDVKVANEERLERIREVFAFHYKTNPFYRSYCKKFGVRPEDIKRVEDINKIPFITTWELKRIFKAERYEYLTVKDIAKRYSSSGTTGKHTFYPFDSKSIRLSNLFNSIALREVVGLTSKHTVLMLLPDCRSCPKGIAQIMHGAYAEITDKIYYLLKEGSSIDFDLLFDILSKTKRVHFFGAHFIWYDLIMELKNRMKKIELSEDSSAIAGGGWKGRKKMMENEELFREIGNVFGIRFDNVRNLWGSTDVNTIFPACECNKIHISPWVYVSIRDMNNLYEEVSVGEEGVMVVHAPTVFSYPAFILIGDVCRFESGYEERCECGRYGATIEIVRRCSEEELYSKGNYIRFCGSNFQ